MEAEGSHVKWRKLDDAEFEKALREKIKEEMAEATASGYEASEVADVHEAVDALERLGISWNDPVYHAMDQFDSPVKREGVSEVDRIEAEQEARRAHLGGYLGRMFVETVGVSRDNPWLEHYLGNPDRYTEVA